MESVEQASFDNESELIQKLYGSLTDKNGFHTFLRDLDLAINASACTLTCLQREPIAIRSVWHMGLPEGFAEAFNKNGMLERDTVFNLAVRGPVRDFSSSSDALHEIQQQGDAEYWAECYEMSMQMGYKQSFWMVVHSTDNSVVVLSLMRLASQEQYTDRELQKVNRLVPHIRQAFQLYEQINDTEAKASSLGAVLDAASKSFIVISDLGRVVHKNRSANEILKDNDVVYIADDHLQFRCKSLKNEFAIYLIEVVRSSLGLTPFYAATQYIKREGRPDLILCLTPIENIEGGRGGALITLLDPELRKFPDSQSIAHYFSLTKAEAALSEELVKGNSLKRISNQFNRSEETLRSHLKQIYLKTGFNRQGQLVAGILSALID